MEEEMEIEEEPVFEVVEVDPDYEFDAARFFDFTREESPPEARRAESWFESVPSYPPSPFVAKLVLREDALLEDASTSPQCGKEEENGDYSCRVTEFSAKSRSTTDHEGNGGGFFPNMQTTLQSALHQPLKLSAGLMHQNNVCGAKQQSTARNTRSRFPRSSTLMKPTASQLAKQTQFPQVSHAGFHKLGEKENERGFTNSTLVESHASKRQKLEGGRLYKVGDTNPLIDLVHKAPKMEQAFDKSCIHAKLKLTIPREPELETAQRAQRARPKNNAEQENVRSAVHRFKARPLNKKILEAPSLAIPKKSIPKLPAFHEFHLKTSERAVQQLSSASSSSHQNISIRHKGLDKSRTVSALDDKGQELGRPNAVEGMMQERWDTKYSFKARPLSKKILSSKGDMGVLRAIKRDTTVPVEFNFCMEKRVQQPPPVELFSKLSLTSELQPSNGSQMKSTQHTSMSTKGPKENRWTGFQLKHEVKGKPPNFGERTNPSFQLKHEVKGKPPNFGERTNPVWA